MGIACRCCEWTPLDHVIQLRTREFIPYTIRFISDRSHFHLVYRTPQFRMPTKQTRRFLGVTKVRDVIDPTIRILRTWIVGSEHEMENPA